MGKYMQRREESHTNIRNSEFDIYSLWKGNYMVSLKNVVKIYNKGKSNAFEALHGISLDIQDGEMAAIIGKSGAGKSTLLHILAGIDSLESGSYQVNGQDIGGLSEKKMAKFRNKMVGIVMQDFALIDEYTVAENVSIPLIFAKVKKKKQKQMIEEVLDRMEMLPMKDKLVSQLSGGQKQRVAIARAVVNRPDFILADEPTGALDTQTSDAIMNVFEQLHKEGRTVIIVTHDMDVANRCGRTIEIEDGNVNKNKEDV